MNIWMKGLSAAVFSLLMLTPKALAYTEQTQATEPAPSIFEDTQPSEKTEQPLTPRGNLTLVDDVQQIAGAADEVQSKQFITLQTKAGNEFFLVIDRAGDTENVYFLNMVDESDLLALIPEEEQPKVECVCQTACTEGHIDQGCSVCKGEMEKCEGEPAPPVEQDTPPQSKGGSKAGLVLLLLLVAGGGGAYYYLRHYQPRAKTEGEQDLDEYDYGEEIEGETDETEGAPNDNPNEVDDTSEDEWEEGD